MPVLSRILRWSVKLLLALTIVLLLALVAVPRFLDRIYYAGPQSSHFDGQRFVNPDGEDMDGPPAGRSRAGFLYRFFTGQDGRPPWPGSVAVTPSRPRAAPSLAPGQMRATWVGHATVLIETPGLTVLTDPIWSDTAGPFGIGPRRVAQPGVAFDDLPRIDLVVVSHNHYDHMDIATLQRLWRRDRPDIVTSLGNDAILRSKGIPARAMDWGQSSPVLNRESCAETAECAAYKPGTVRVTRNHHWGSRWGVDRNRALWSSFVVETPAGPVFFAGDTGPGDMQWPLEAARLASAPIRLAIIPIGAFRFRDGQDVTGSHIGPIHAAAAFDQFGSATGLPIHWGTFRLSWESYLTPPRHLDQVMRCRNLDPGRFAPHAIGVSFDVDSVPPTPAQPRPFDPAALAASEACLKASATYRDNR